MKYLFVVLMSLFASAAHADWFHFEPYVGYNRGQEQATQMQGLGFGARVGIDFNTIFLVADIGYNTVQQSSLNEVTYNDTAIVLGGNIRSFRVWYGMITSAGFSYESGGTSVKTKGKGSKIGVGGLISDKMSLNLEARFYNYTDRDGAVIDEIGTVGFLSVSWVL